MRSTLYRRAAALPHVEVLGIDCHIGSQITDLAVCVEAAEKVFALADRARGATASPLAHLDVGGGLGIRYRDEEPTDARRVRAGRQRARGEGAPPQRLLFEPGRVLVGNAGVLLTRVLVPQARRGEETSRSSTRR